MRQDNRFLHLLDRVLERYEQRRWIHGLLGRLEADETRTMPVDDKPGFYFVALGVDGDQGNDIARVVGNVALRPGVPVRMLRENGVLNIYSDDRQSGLLDDDDSTNEYGVPPHPLGVHNDVTLTEPAGGEALIFDHDTSRWVNRSIPYPPVISVLQDLYDVTMDYGTLMPGQFLSFSPTGQWTNVDLPAGATALVDLTDVTLTEPADGEVLMYDDVSGMWVNQSIPYPPVISVLQDLYDVTMDYPSLAPGQIMAFSPMGQWGNIDNPAVRHDGTVQMSGDWDFGAYTLLLETIQARPSTDLRLRNHLGDLAIFVGQQGPEPGSVPNLGIFTDVPATQFEIAAQGVKANLWQGLVGSTPQVVIASGMIGPVIMYRVKNLGDDTYAGGVAVVVADVEVACGGSTFGFSVFGGALTVAREAGSDTADIMLWMLRDG